MLLALFLTGLLQLASIGVLSAGDRVLFSGIDQFQAIADKGKGTVQKSGTVLLSSNGKHAEPWVVQYQSGPVQIPIRAGDVLCFSFDARLVDLPATRKGADATREMGVAEIFFARSEPWRAIDVQKVSETLLFSREWASFDCCCRSDSHFDTNQVYVTLHFGFQEQKIEIRNPKLTYLGDKPEQDWPYAAVNYQGRSPEATWRKEAKARIERIRKSELTIRVQNQRGEPVPDAKVEIQQLRHQFAFGSFTDAILDVPSTDSSRYQETMKSLFNRVTLPRYWADWGTEKPEEIEKSDRIAQWAKDEGFELKTHVLLYPKVMPERVKRLRGNAASLKAEIDREVDATLEKTKRYPCVAWDAFNELRDEPLLHEVFGHGFYAEMFQKANAIQPGVKWFINEYDILSPSKSQESNIALYEKTILRIMEEGGPIEGIGFQGHFGNVLTPIPQVLEILDRFARFKIPLEITEFDVNIRDEQAQGDYTRDMLIAAFSHPQVEGFTIWGFWEGKIWRSNGAMIRKDWSFKPNGKAWRDLVVNEWRTNETKPTSKEGLVSLRAFHGTYQVRVSHSNASVTRKVTLLKEDGNKDLAVQIQVD